MTNIEFQESNLWLYETNDKYMSQVKLRKLSEKNNPNTERRVIIL